MNESLCQQLVIVQGVHCLRPIGEIGSSDPNDKGKMEPPRQLWVLDGTRVYTGRQLFTVTFK